MFDFLLELLLNYNITMLVCFICGAVFGCAGMVLLDELRKGRVEIVEDPRDDHDVVAKRLLESCEF